MIKPSHVLWVLLWVSATAMAGNPMNGAKIYKQHCVNCHGANGRSMMPGVPDFSVGQGLIKPDQSLEQVIKTGKKVMPGYLGILSDAEIDDVITYIRTLR